MHRELLINFTCCMEIPVHLLELEHGQMDRRRDKSKAYTLL